MSTLLSILFLIVVDELLNATVQDKKWMIVFGLNENLDDLDFTYDLFSNKRKIAEKDTVIEHNVQE